MHRGLASEYVIDEVRMFGAVQCIAGCRRLYPVKDRVTVHQVLERTRQASPACIVHTLQWRDVSKIDTSETVIAVNPAGRQSYLVLDTLGGRSVCFLVHAPSRTVELVPLRFSHALHDRSTVMKCTVCTQDRMIVINDVYEDAPARSVADRLKRVHQVAHSEHTPDAALFPLRIVARRCFSFAQTSELKRFLGHSNARYHSLSLIGPSEAGRELRIQVANKREQVRHMRASTPTVGHAIDANVVAAHGPDAYKFQVDPADPDTWQYLTVKTIEESTALANMDLSIPRICRLAWDGSGWRIVMCAVGVGALCADSEPSSEKR